MFLTRPAGLLLTPGASADRDHSTLVAIDEAMPELVVHRLTLSTTSIPRAVAKVVEATVALAAELGTSTEDIIIGGRSFGGRACSVAAADGLAVGGLLLLSYPLHPPGKPDNLRVDHFPAITVPTMFISGRKDPFGTPQEFDDHVGSIAAETTLSWVDGGHAPKGPAEQEVVRLVRAGLLWL
jgi:predicted alpha/beta-hydrolase family hydrolase